MLGSARDRRGRSWVKAARTKASQTPAVADAAAPAMVGMIRRVPDPFFIVGNDRSGTTMLRLILDHGPDVAIPPESMFLTDFAAAFDAGGPQNERSAAELMH